MGNTTKLENRTIQIKGLDADWSLPGDMGADFDKCGLKIKHILFYPSGANDVVHIKEASPGYTATASLVTALTATAPDVALGKSIAGETLKFDIESWKRPFIDISDCVFSSAASARIDIELM